MPLAPSSAKCPSLAARDLFQIGLNVFPQPYGAKIGAPWKRLQYTRLYGPYLDRLFQGKCNVAVMCGRTSRNLFVLDAETPAIFARHLDEARLRQIPLWVVGTARGGHLYFFCSDGEIQNVTTGTLESAEVRGSNSYVLAPPSLHPDGVFYDWQIRDGSEPPTVHADQIDWLTNLEGSPVKLKVKRPQTMTSTSSGAQLAKTVAATFRRPDDPRFWSLSRKTLDYLQNGAHIADGSRNKRFFHAACDLYGCDFAPSEIERMTRPNALASGLAQGEFERSLHSAVGQFRRPSRPRGQTPTAPLVKPRLVLAAIQQQTWPGRTGSTDRMMVLALYERLCQGGNQAGIFRAAYSELGRLARVSNNGTIKKALTRLVNAGIIEHVGTDSRSQAGLWRFTDAFLDLGRGRLQDPVCQTEPLYFSMVKGSVCQKGIRSINHSLSHTEQSSTDAAERGALGPEGILVYRKMVDIARPLQVAEIATATGLTRDRVNYRLKKLLKYALVEKSGRVWLVCKVLDAAGLDIAVAQPADTLGKAQKRYDAFVANRAKFVSRVILRYRRLRDPFFGVDF